MDLKDYGWNSFFKECYNKLETEYKPAIVCCRYSNYYDIICAAGKYSAELSGAFVYNTVNISEFPAVGDWILVDLLKGETKAVIHEVLPRKSCFSRKAPDGKENEQVIAANIDMLCIVTGLDNNFNPNRIERYITQAYNSGAAPLIILNKVDLVTSRDSILLELEKVVIGADVVFLSTITGEGIEQLRCYLKKGKVSAFAGSSGVGKSSIINMLVSDALIKTKNVREKDSKGRHTTSARQMFKTKDGAIIIDTPGMRELGLWSSGNALNDSINYSINKAFEEIAEISEHCKFNNCSHDKEPGCAVKQALSEGNLSPERYGNYIKLQKEIEYLKRKVDIKVSGNTKKRWKEITKQIRKDK